jgi:chromosome segregation protein
METISAVETDLTQKQQSLDKEEQEQRSLEEKSRRASKEVNEARVNLVTFQARCDQLRLDADRLEQIENDLLANMQARQTEIGEIDQQKEALKAQIAQLDQELQERSRERAELQEQEEHLKEDEASLLKTQQEIEAQIKSGRESRESVQIRTHEYELQVAEIEAKQQAAAERIQQEYQLSMEELPESQEAPEQEISLEEKQERIQFLRERIRIMGPVNMAALEEYSVQKERLDFLSTQRDDLLQAEENLNQVIANLNRRARRLFTRTFKKVNQNFKTIFTQMFDGGEADLILDGKGDPLEADIEILACPGGKKLRHIAQLSGGEKALTAISLLFSLYQVKPSPFCVLDEVDAPLDDANINRFVELLRNLSEQSQFIIITHNKNTMAAADVLYGVTMEQLGISKVVSVNLRQGEDTVAA